MTEATALPTEPQQLPTIKLFYCDEQWQWLWFSGQRACPLLSQY